MTIYFHEASIIILIENSDNILISFGNVQLRNLYTTNIKIYLCTYVYAYRKVIILSNSYNERVNVI
jgi:hypothetical protein